MFLTIKKIKIFTLLYGEKCGKNNFITYNKTLIMVRIVTNTLLQFIMKQKEEVLHDSFNILRSDAMYPGSTCARAQSFTPY